MRRNISFLLWKNKAKLLLVVLLLICTSCITRNAISEEERQNLRELIGSKQFEIQHQWAEPVGGDNVNLTGNANYIRIMNDSASVFLPYFGTVDFIGGFDRRGGGIKFEGVPKDLKIEEQEDKIILSFEGQQKNENLQFLITLYADRSVYTSVNSSQRNRIAYRGYLRPLKK